ncbi:hypothetical protein DLAC_09011 [Tieghemostelium lacteum]|uniref:BRCT domain-containing protein n=1 Tax=Tieghemostelium lacteum TaxID=361077 RepID=A0A151Z955_TIELA|nr:hypothetical protein DLAC_09011 [Tieghemostelium lacteum]|eukprot:KYQ90394.1 hypothetical protein DLAC_09011 [Tieghemostelium lacteum]
MFQSLKAWFSRDSPTDIIGKWKENGGKIALRANDAYFIFVNDPWKVDSYRLITSKDSDYEGIAFIKYDWIQDSINSQQMLDCYDYVIDRDEVANDNERYLSNIKEWDEQEEANRLKYHDVETDDLFLLNEQREFNSSIYNSGKSRKTKNLIESIYSKDKIVHDINTIVAPNDIYAVIGGQLHPFKVSKKYTSRYSKPLLPKLLDDNISSISEDFSYNKSPITKTITEDKIKKVSPVRQAKITEYTKSNTDLYRDVEWTSGLDDKDEEKITPKKLKTTNSPFDIDIDEYENLVSSPFTKQKSTTTTTSKYNSSNNNNKLKNGNYISKELESPKKPESNHNKLSSVDNIIDLSD